MQILREKVWNNKTFCTSTFYLGKYSLKERGDREAQDARKKGIPVYLENRRKVGSKI